MNVITWMVWQLGQYVNYAVMNHRGSRIANYERHTHVAATMPSSYKLYKQSRVLPVYPHLTSIFVAKTNKMNDNTHACYFVCLSTYTCTSTCTSIWYLAYRLF